MKRIINTFAILLSCIAVTTSPAADEKLSLPPGAIARFGSTAFLTSNPFSVTFSADSTALLAHEGAEVIGWDAKTGARLAKPPIPAGYAFELDGSRLRAYRGIPIILTEPIAHADDKRVLSVVDKDRKAVLQFVLKDMISAREGSPAIASPDWSQVAVVTETAVTIRATAMGREVASFKRDKAGELLVRFAPDGACS